eukprot:5589018-Amphidinium_carterae.1
MQKMQKQIQKSVRRVRICFMKEEMHRAPKTNFLGELHKRHNFRMNLMIMVLVLRCWLELPWFEQVARCKTQMTSQ